MDTQEEERDSSHYTLEAIVARQGLGALLSHEKASPSGVAAAQQLPPAAVVVTAGAKAAAGLKQQPGLLLPPLQRLRRGLLATAAMYELLSHRLTWLNPNAMQVELRVRGIQPPLQHACMLQDAIRFRVGAGTVASCMIRDATL